jgi:demethylmenaquinone methyltransferase/2-methoxy-6-polyprenyl-1,4-benzoquinol methylase
MTDPAANRELFTRIAHRYDLLNRILSLGQEQSWRARVAAHLPPGRVLDLGSGTGAALPVLAGRVVVGLDPVPAMLRLSPIHDRVAAVGERLPFRDGSFDGVFSAYVLRNLTSIEQTLAEIWRVLRPGGVAALVDLARPRHLVTRALHRAGTAVVLPFAGTIAGAPREYWYLHRSLDKLPPPEELLSGGPLRLRETWRMGPLGFVYGAVLTRNGEEAPPAPRA